MNIISYRYTNSMKQVFLFSWMLFFLLYIATVVEMVIFKVPGYSTLNALSLLLYYVVFLAVLILVFIGYKFFYTLYDEDTVIYYNKLTRKEYSVDLSDVNKVVFQKKGIDFYTMDAGEKPSLHIPLFRGGIIDAVELDKFYQAMKAREGVVVYKEFTVLPGYGKLFTVIKVIYLILAAYTLLNCATPLAAFIAVFKSFA